MSNDTCCPVFNPDPWDEESHTWNDKPFLVDTVPQIFHIPIPGTYGRTVGRMWELAKKCGIMPPEKDFMMLAYDPSPWKSELHLAVTGESASVNIVKLSGTFISKVFDGPYKNVPQYMLDMEDYAHGIGKKIDKYFFWYTTCPKCAKKYGHNYIVAFGHVAQ
jgi:hypothetical protein